MYIGCRLNTTKDEDIIDLLDGKDKTNVLKEALRLYMGSTLGLDEKTLRQILREELSGVQPVKQEQKEEEEPVLNIAEAGKFGW